MGFFRDNVTKKYVTNNTTITEKRAPTDESVRLLKEFEEKAEAKFINRIDIKTNLIEYTLLEFHESATTYPGTFQYFTNINGKDYSGQVTVNKHNDNYREEFLEKIHLDLAQKLTRNIIIETISENNLKL